jgi:hypothetical protein
MVRHSTINGTTSSSAYVHTENASFPNPPATSYPIQFLPSSLQLNICFAIDFQHLALCRRRSYCPAARSWGFKLSQDSYPVRLKSLERSDGHRISWLASTNAKIHSVILRQEHN